MRCFKSLLLTSALAFVPGAAYAVPVGVVHIGLEQDGQQFSIDQMISFLQTDRRFDSVTEIDVDTDGVPTLNDLSGFDALLVTTDSRSGNITGGGLGTQLGNVFDDFVGGGGRLVMSAFTGNSGIGVDGEVTAIAPFASVGGNAAAGVLDLSLVDPMDLLFDGVTNFDSNFASTVNLSVSGVLLASYESGTPGLITNDDGTFLFINAFPGDNASLNQQGNDFGNLFANALFFQATDGMGDTMPPAPPPPSPPPPGPTPIPEPASAALLGAGLAALGLARRKRKIVL